MEMYAARQIAFKELLSIDGWAVKTYVISKFDNFGGQETYRAALEELPRWLTQKNSFDASHDQMAFLIVHEGSEETFSLINWWVGGNMLHTEIFISEKDHPSTFRKISGDGLAPCVWELEVINFERTGWTEHILKKHPSPDFQSYLEQQITTKI